MAEEKKQQLAEPQYMDPQNPRQKQLRSVHEGFNQLLLQEQAGMKLNDFQRDLVINYAGKPQKYLDDLNTARAAKRAGYDLSKEAENMIESMPDPDEEEQDLQLLAQNIRWSNPENYSDEYAKALASSYLQKQYGVKDIDGTQLYGAEKPMSGKELLKNVQHDLDQYAQAQLTTDLEAFEQNDKETQTIEAVRNLTPGQKAELFSPADLNMRQTTKFNEWYRDQQAVIVDPEKRQVELKPEDYERAIESTPDERLRKQMSVKQRKQARDMYREKLFEKDHSAYRDSLYSAMDDQTKQFVTDILNRGYTTLEEQRQELSRLRMARAEDVDLTTSMDRLKALPEDQRVLAAQYLNLTKAPKESGPASVKQIASTLERSIDQNANRVKDVFEDMTMQALSMADPEGWGLASIIKNNERDARDLYYQMQKDDWVDKEGFAGTWQWASTGAAEQIPYMLTAATRPSFAFITFPLMIDEARSSLKANGVPDQQAQFWSVPVGLAMAGIERLQALGAIGKGSGVSTKAFSSRLSKYMLGRFAGQTTKTATIETLEEGVQQGIQSVASSFMVPEHKIQNAWNDVVETVKQVSGPMTLISLFSGGRAAFSGRASTAAKKKASDVVEIQKNKKVNKKEQRKQQLQDQIGAEDYADRVDTWIQAESQQEKQNAVKGLPRRVQKDMEEHLQQKEQVMKMEEAAKSIAEMETWKQENLEQKSTAYLRDVASEYGIDTSEGRDAIVKRMTQMRQRIAETPAEQAFPGRKRKRQPKYEMDEEIDKARDMWPRMYVSREDMSELKIYNLGGYVISDEGMSKLSATERSKIPSWDQVAQEGADLFPGLLSGEENSPADVFEAIYQGSRYKENEENLDPTIPNNTDNPMIQGRGLDVGFGFENVERKMEYIYAKDKTAVHTVTEDGVRHSYGLDEDLAPLKMMGESIDQAKQTELLNREPEPQEGGVEAEEGGEVPFSVRAEQASENARKVYRNHIARIAREFLDKLERAPQVEVVESVSDLPSEVQSLAADAEVEGLTYGDTVYLVASNLPTPNKARAKLMHEVIGHNSLRAALGERYGEAMQSVIDEVGMERIQNSIPKFYHGQSEYQQAEEYLARIAEDVEQEQVLAETERSVWRRIIDWFRELIGMSPRNELTRNEHQSVAVYLRKAIEFSRKEQLMPSLDVQFSVRDNTSSADTQIHNPVRMKALDVAYRRFKGQNITDEQIQQDLGAFGMENQLTAVKQKADMLLTGLEQQRQQLQNDQQIREELENEELFEHYRQRIEHARQTGEVNAEEATRAQERLREVIRHHRNRAARARRGMNADDVANLLNIDLAKYVGQIGDKESETAFKDLSQPIADLVRERLVVEGFMQEGEKVKDNNIALAEYRRTLRNIFRRIQTNLEPNKRNQLIRHSEQITAQNNWEEINRQGREAAKAYAKNRVKQTRQGLVQQITKLFKKKVFKGPASYQQAASEREIDAQYQLKGRLIKEALDQSARKVDNTIDQLEEQIDAFEKMDNTEAGVRFLDHLAQDVKGKDVVTLRGLKQWDTRGDTYETMKEVYQVLYNYGAIRSRQRDIGHLAQIYEELQSFVDEGVSQAEKNRHERRKREKKEAETIMNGTPGRPKGEPYPPELSWKQKQKFSMYAFEKKVQDLTDYASKAARKKLRDWISGITEQITRADNGVETYQRKAGDTLQKEVKRIYNVGNHKAANILFDIRKRDPANKDLSREGRPLSTGQLMQIYLTGTQPEYADNFEQNERSGEYWERLMNRLSEEDLQLAEFFRQWWRDSLPELADAVEKQTGLRLVSPNPYFHPAKFKMPTDDTPTEIMTAPLYPTWMVQRVNHTHDIDESVDVVSIWMQRVQDSARLIHFGEINHKLRKLFFRRDVADHIEKQWGPDVKEALQEHVGAIINGATATRNTKKNMASDLRNLLAWSTFAGNMKMWLVQPSSFVAYGFEVGVHNVPLAISKLPTAEGRKAFREILQSEEIQNRLKFGGSEYIQHLLQSASTASSTGKFKRDFAKALNASMMVRYADLVPLLTVGPGLYVDRYQTNIDKGLSEAEARKDAMTFVANLHDKTQQTRHIQGLADWQRMEGQLGRALGMFISTPRQFFEYEARALTELYRRLDAESMKKAANTLFINHVLLPGFYTAGQQIFAMMLGESPGADDEDQNRLITRLVVNMITSPFVGFPLAGFVGEFTVRSAILRKPGHAMVPVESLRFTAKSIGEMIKNMIQGDFDEAMKDWLEIMGGQIQPIRYLKERFGEEE